MLADSNHEIVVGAIGQFWKPAAVKTFINVTGPQAFLDFNHKGFAKVAMNLAVQPDGNKAILSIETRIWVPDGKTRKKFVLYWRIHSLGKRLDQAHVA